MSTLSDLRSRAVNERRQQLFGDSSLTVYSTTPADGETLAGTFTADWFAHRVWKTTDQGVKEEGGWQFQIVAADDWETTDAFMLTIVALKVGTQRWKVTKIEEPVGNSLIWKVKAQKQS